MHACCGEANSVFVMAAFAEKRQAQQVAPPLQADKLWHVHRMSHTASLLFILTLLRRWLGLFPDAKQQQPQDVNHWRHPRGTLLQRWARQGLARHRKKTLWVRVCTVRPTVATACACVCLADKHPQRPWPCLNPLLPVCLA